jgi:hypothetical protein
VRNWRYSSTALNIGTRWSTSCPFRFTPRERAPGTHYIERWVGPRVVLGVMDTSRSTVYFVIKKIITIIINIIIIYND